MESLLSLALSNAIVATLLAVMVTGLARLLRRRPTVVHGLWLLVLLKLLTPPLIPLSITWSRTGDALPSAVESPPPSFTEAEEPATSLPGAHEESVSTQSEPSPAPVAATAFWEPAILLVWLSGSLAWSALAGVRLLRFHRLLREANAAPDSVQQQGRHLAALLGVRRCPPVLLVAAPLSPMLWALGFSPRLLVPADLWARLHAEQRDTLLAHELAHLRRGDHWVRRLEFIVLGLYWWHPIVWWARRRLQEAEEECCDAYVVAVLPDAASAYASVLVETVAFLSQTRMPALLGGSGAGQVPLLKRRLTMILTENLSRNSSRAGFWAVLSVGAFLLPLTPGAAQTEPPAAPDQPTRAASKSQPDEGERQLFARHAMENCASCHQAPVHSRDLQRKPQTWRETHDEAIRLMDEARRKQAELTKAGNRLPATTERERAEEIEKLQDEIELLKVQVRVKEVHLEAARADSAAAERVWQRITQIDRGIISESQRAKAETEAITQKAQVRVKVAELQEPLIRLKQAERRLARLQRPAERSAGAGSDLREQRLRELEKKVNQILDEMKTLQRERHPQAPNYPPPGVGQKP